MTVVAYRKSLYSLNAGDPWVTMIVLHILDAGVVLIIVLCVVCLNQTYSAHTDIRTTSASKICKILVGPGTFTVSPLIVHFFKSGLFTNWNRDYSLCKQKPTTHSELGFRGSPGREEITVDMVKYLYGGFKETHWKENHCFGFWYLQPFWSYSRKDGGMSVENLSIAHYRAV